MNHFKKSILFTATIMAALFSSCHSNHYTASDEYIHYMGRVDRSNPNMVRFSYPGVTIRTKFKGSSITARLKDFAEGSKEMHNTFYCIIDGEAPKKIVLSKGQTEYLLANRLNPVEDHTLELIKLTESVVGDVEFHGFIVGDKENGSLMEPIAFPALKMEFIGNSISCGYGNELSSETPKMGFSPLNENNYYAWGAVAARALDAQYVCTAYSGKGLCRNFEGDCCNTIPQFYNHTLADNHEKRWDFKRYTPDIVVLNMGTNDFGAENTTHQAVDSIQFIAEYKAFLSRLKSYYPEANLICAVGPMVNEYSGEIPLQLTRYSEYVLSAINEAGGEENNIFYFETKPQLPPFGEDYHPTKEKHEEMANELVSFILEKGLEKK